MGSRARHARPPPSRGHKRGLPAVRHEQGAARNQLESLQYTAQQLLADSTACELFCKAWQEHFADDPLLRDIDIRDRLQSKLAIMTMHARVGVDIRRWVGGNLGRNANKSGAVALRPRLQATSGKNKRALAGGDTAAPHKTKPTLTRGIASVQPQKKRGSASGNKTAPPKSMRARVGSDVVVPPKNKTAPPKTIPALVGGDMAVPPQKKTKRVPLGDASSRLNEIVV